MTTATYDTRVCRPGPEDVRGDPARCVIARHIERQHPWAKHVSVGVQTIRVWDYRCEHNPEGKCYRCALCPGRKLVWSTPQTAARAIRAFDKGGAPEFPAFKLREDEAEVVAATQDRVRKRRSGVIYRERVVSGELQVNHRSPKAMARAKSDRRKG